MVQMPSLQQFEYAGCDRRKLMGVPGSSCITNPTLQSARNSR